MKRLLIIVLIAGCASVPVVENNRSRQESVERVIDIVKQQPPSVQRDWIVSELKACVQSLDDKDIQIAKLKESNHQLQQRLAIALEEQSELAEDAGATRFIKWAAYAVFTLLIAGIAFIVARRFIL